MPTTIKMYLCFDFLLRKLLTRTASQRLFAAAGLPPEGVWLLGVGSSSGCCTGKDQRGGGEQKAFIGESIMITQINNWTYFKTLLMTLFILQNIGYGIVFASKVKSIVLVVFYFIMLLGSQTDQNHPAAFSLCVVSSLFSLISSFCRDCSTPISLIWCVR